MPKNFKNLTGQTFYGWTALERDPDLSQQGNVVWKIQHTCGHIKFALGWVLKAGKVKCACTFRTPILG